MNKWYKGQYRRNLVDMHINDTSEEYLSSFSAEDYFNYLKKAKITAPMIYLQSHTGLCNYPTKVSKTHAFFLKNPDEIRKLIKLCHEAGMKVVGYYSLIFNNQAIYDHPEWEMIFEDGSTWRERGQRYGLCCPNNEEYRNFVRQNIQELADFYPDLDGIFYDMPYWEVTCHCQSCQTKWEEKHHYPLPTKLDFSNPVWNEYVKARQDFMGDFVQFVRKTSEEILKGVTVEFNFAAAVACDWLAGSTEIINEECEFTGGDLYGDLYNHSFAAKYYYTITKNQPFEYMTCRCNYNLRQHTISKNELTLESEVMLTCMHHGASLIIDAINPDGTLDNRVATRLGKVFENQIPYEPYMDKGELYSDVAIYYDTTSNYEYLGIPYNRQSATNVMRTLIENHVPTSIVANKHLNDLDKYKLIIAPSMLNCKQDDITKFIDYVRDGGILYLSGLSNEKLLNEFFGLKITGLTFGDSKYPHVYKGYDEVQCYIRPTNERYKKIFNEFNDKYPLPVIYKLPIFTFTKGEVMAKLTYPYTDPDNNTIFASIHSNPPGKDMDIPAILEVNYGKGKVIYSSALIEQDNRYNYKEIFMNMVKPYLSNILEVKASPYVEEIVFKDNDDLYLNLFDLNFANDVVTREYAIKLPNNVEVYELPTNNKIAINGNILKGQFQKYISLLIKKI